MDVPPPDPAHAVLPRAIEENAAEFLLALGRAGGAEERQDASVHWTIGGSPIASHNGVVRASLVPESADAAIVASMDRFRACNVPGTRHVGPAMRPHDVGNRLLAHCFTFAGAETGMAVELQALPATVEAPAALRIERVTDARGLAAWVRTLGQGFGEGEREASWVGAMYQRIGLEDDRPWRHCLGRLDGSPAATTSLFLGAGVAGVYFVFTVPPARRQGIGGPSRWRRCRMRGGWAFDSLCWDRHPWARPCTSASGSRRTAPSISTSGRHLCNDSSRGSSFTRAGRHAAAGAARNAHRPDSLNHVPDEGAVADCGRQSASRRTPSRPASLVELERALAEEHDAIALFYTDKPEPLLGHVAIWDPAIGPLNMLQVLRVGVHHDQHHYRAVRSLLQR